MSKARAEVDDVGRPKAKKAVTVAVVLAFFAGLLVMLPEVGAQDDDFSCSVEPAEGGVLVSWAAVDGATAYQYKFDVEGRGSSYQRVTGTSVLIPLGDGLVGTVGLAPVMADGTGPARTNCGSASPLEGTGEQDLVCSVESVEGGVNVSWNEINGAVTYAYRLDVPNRSSRYQRVTGTSTFIGLPDGVTGTVAMTPVFADGSTRSRVPCGSGAPLEGTGTIDLTCSVVSDPGGVRVSWNNVPGAVTFGYRLRIEGRGDSYGRVNGRSAVIPVDAGVLATIGMNPVAADGSTVARTSCGTAVGGGNGGGGGDPLTIATCASSADGNDVRYNWTVAGDEDDFGNYRINYSVVRPEPGTGFSEVAREFDVDARTYRIGLQPGDVVTSSLQVTYGDQTRSATVDCGTTTIPEEEPELLTVATCVSSADGTDIKWDWTVTGEPRDNFFSYRIGYAVERQEPGNGFSEVAREFDVDVRSYQFALVPGDVVTSTIYVEYGGGNGAEDAIDCGTTLIPVEQDPLRLQECLTFGLTDTISWFWTVTGDPAAVQSFALTYTVQRDGVEIVQTETIDSPTALRTDIDLEFGDVLTSNIRINYLDGTVGPTVDCGTLTVGGTLAPGECEIDGTSLSFSYDEPATFGIYFSTEGQRERELFRNELGSPVEITGTPGSVVTVSIQVLIGRDFSPRAECGSVTIPG